MQTDTQVVVNPAEAFLPGSQAFGSTPEPQAQVPETKTVTPQAEAPQVAPVPPQAQEGQNTPEVDPVEAAIEASLQPAETFTWDDKAKGAFKNLFGHEDPTAFKADLDARFQEAELLKAEYEKLAPMKAQFDALPPSMQRAYQLAMEGKADEAQKYLQELPTDVFLNREAKNIPSDKLVDTYLPGKMSKEDWAALKDPDTDPDVKAALEAKSKHYRDIASDMHERKREAVAGELASRQQAQQQAIENYNKSTAKALAAASNDPVLKTFLTPDVKQDIQTGQFLKQFVDDGFAPTEKAVTNYLWALHGPKIAQAQFNVGYRKGKNEGALEATALQPGAPPAHGRVTGGTPPANSEESVKESILSRLGMGA